MVFFIEYHQKSILASKNIDKKRKIKPFYIKNGIRIYLYVFFSLTSENSLISLSSNQQKKSNPYRVNLPCRKPLKTQNETGEVWREKRNKQSLIYIRITLCKKTCSNMLIYALITLDQRLK